MDWSFLTAVAALLTSLTAIYLGQSQRKKNSADTAKAVTDALDHVIVRLRNEMDELEKEIENLKQRENFLEARIEQEQKITESLRERVRNLEKENAELRAGVQLLTLQVVALGQNPLYPPPRPNEPK